MKVTLLISTYNRADALDVVLDAVAAQTRMPDEVVICDDGSGAETRDVIDRWRDCLPVPVIHVWQPDDGFRVAAARNKGLAAATGDYIVQIDGDIMIERHFIADHIAKATPGYYIKGSRVRLTPEASARICRERKAVKIPFLSGDVMKDRLKNFRLAPLGLLSGRRYRRSVGGIGCNISYWRADALTINGYDEHYRGWGAEDDDFCVRLKTAGVLSFKLLRMGLCWHLWHNERPNSRLDDAYEYLKARIAAGTYVAEHGISQYLKKIV